MSRFFYQSGLEILSGLVKLESNLVGIPIFSALFSVRIIQQNILPVDISESIHNDNNFLK